MTILTPNRRLAATLQKRYQQQQALTTDCWITPDILPLTSWIQRLWLDHAYADNAPYLLNAAQEQFVWETVIRQSNESSRLLQLSETAELAKSAYGLMKQWQIDVTLPEFSSSEDYLALRAWVCAFETMCVENNWISTAGLVEVLIEKTTVIPRLDRGIQALQPPLPISLIGFTELSPQINALIDAYKVGRHCEERSLRRSNPGFDVAVCELSSYKAEAESHSLDCFVANSAPRNDGLPRPHSRITTENDDAEILLMARWAKSHFDAHEDAIIGCVIPTLEKSRDRAIQLYTDVFKDKSAFNVSAGKRLNEFPVIHAALQLLSLNKKSISRTALSYLLTSPFLGSSEKERVKRAFVDRALRQNNTNNIKLDQLDAYFTHCPAFLALLKQYLQLIEQYPDTASYKEWAEKITQSLTSCGWPGERSVNSAEYQTVDAWYTALNEFTTLDHIAKPVSYYDALVALKRIVMNTIFQTKTPDARVQVLGLLEAAGSPFDYLWVAGMDDLAWPPQPKPHPFIPKSLQRQLNMPHATAERELLFCTTVTNQFKENATHIIFSHAKENAELERQVSPLLSNLPEITQHELFLDTYITPDQLIFQSQQLQTLTDNLAPALKEGEKVHGGMSIIKKQAMCAFKAFAEHRLHAHELEKPLLGLRKKDRGELIHKVMETLWNKLIDHSTLINTNDEDLSILINDSIENAFQVIPTSHTDYPNYITLEKKRLAKLTWQWLQLEKTRPPFKVSNNEKKSTIQLGKLTLSVRIDRIDELMDGRQLIIDYKTGKDNSAQAWFGARPDEPQLPLYALLEPEQTFGITFAQLYPGKYLFSGLSQLDLDMKGIKPHLQWHEQLTEWRSVLTKLSDDFSCGVANVDPKEISQTCEWCALQPLCRIKEAHHHGNL